MDFVSALCHRQCCRQAISLEATERIVIIEHKTDFHKGSMRAWAVRHGNMKRGASKLKNKVKNKVKNKGPVPKK
jgi:hypothetical protein